MGVADEHSFCNGVKEQEDISGTSKFTRRYVDMENDDPFALVGTWTDKEFCIDRLLFELAGRETADVFNGSAERVSMLLGRCEKRYDSKFGKFNTVKRGMTDGSGSHDDFKA